MEIGRSLSTAIPATLSFSQVVATLPCLPDLVHHSPDPVLCRQQLGVKSNSFRSSHDARVSRLRAVAAYSIGHFADSSPTQGFDCSWGGLGVSR